MKQIFICFFLLFFAFVYATIINIPADQPTIQEGIDAAVDADTVLVQPGTYVENIDYNGKNITVASLFLTTQDTTYISQTIIDGDSIDSVVKFVGEEDSTAVLTGFTITNGSAVFGGGICCGSSSPSLDNLTISGNSATELYGSGGGGGIYFGGGNPSLMNVTITGNSASIKGGGISCRYSNPSLVNVTITDNYDSNVGGGIYCSYSNPSFENVTISGNSVNWHGGGIYCYESSPSLVNVTITGNNAWYGGGIYCVYNSNPSLLNSIFWNNTPEEVYFYGDYYSSSITISYSDIQGGEAGIVTNNNGTVYWLEGNIDEDPLFVDPANGDYHLTVNSPCIDAGDPTSPLDPDGTIADMGAFYYHQVNDMDDNEIQIVGYHLSNHPNPFNPLTTIRFDINEHENGTLRIFNIKGQLIESHRFESGKHNYLWDAANQASGIYLYKLQTQTITETRKMILLK